MTPRTLASVVLCLASFAAPAAAQGVKIEFDNGKVTLVAQNAPVRAILAEWARLGGATIVNGDRMVGTPMTLQLSGVPERQALDIVLRGAAGYMLAPRRAGSKAASAFDRILILPTSTAPRVVPAAAPTPFNQQQRPPVVRQLPQLPGRQPGGDDPDNAADGPIILGGPQSPPRIPATLPTPVPRPIGVEPEVIGADDDAPNQPPATAQPQPAPGAPTTVSPFTVPAGSSTRPGVIVPAPQPQPQRPSQQ
jgi:hypothetical protein